MQGGALGSAGLLGGSKAHRAQDVAPSEEFGFCWTPGWDILGMQVSALCSPLECGLA